MPPSDLRLLFVTQELDRTSSNLAVAHIWASALAQRAAAVHVVAARVGEVDLPPNAHVHGLGRERGRTRARAALDLGAVSTRLLASRRVDAVLAHMVPAYAVMLAPAARLTGAPLALWYTSHGRSFMLALANRLIDAAVTASADSYPVRSKRAYVLGHGVETDRFTPPPGRQPRAASPMIGMAGRLTPLKSYEYGIQAVAILRRTTHPGARLRIAGEPFYTRDRMYVRHLRALAISLGVAEAVEFVGAVRGDAITAFYGSLDVFVTWRQEPALDKTGLEALACATPIVTNNTAYRDVLGEMADDCLVGRTLADLAVGIQRVLGMTEHRRQAAVDRARANVLRDHDAAGLANRVLDVCEALRRGARPAFPSVADARPTA